MFYFLFSLWVPATVVKESWWHKVSFLPEHPPTSTRDHPSLTFVSSLCCIVYCRQLHANTLRLLEVKDSTENSRVKDIDKDTDIMMIGGASFEWFIYFDFPSYFSTEHIMEGKANSRLTPHIKSNHVHYYELSRSRRVWQFDVCR